MKKNVIQEAIANIASTSAALKKHCNDPKNYNSASAAFLARVVCELSLQMKDLEDIQQEYGVEYVG